MNKKYELIIIGGGAAGLYCGASHNNKQGNKAILEAGNHLGTKMLMSGSGQCNVTHGGSIKDFPIQYGDGGKKVRGCLFKYSNTHLCDFLASLGVETFTREDGKVFPKSMDAHSIVYALINQCEKNGFAIKTQCKVEGISYSDGLFHIKVGSGEFLSKKVIIATGGCSYPTTGSDGSMFRILEDDLDMEIIKPRPALVPIKVEGYNFTELSGISFEKITTIITEASGKKVASLQGPMVLTHTEFSGPGVLDISKFAQPGMKLVINYVNMNFEDARQQLSDKVQTSKASLENIVAETFNLPKRFAAEIINISGTKVKDITMKLTNDTYLISGTSGFAKAMATTGGVALNSVDLKTMEAKAIKGLYVVGEALDIDGRTGGYNLQFAYSSAMAAINNL